MPAVLALKINPYMQRVDILELEAGPEPAQRELGISALFESDGQRALICKEHVIKVSHWELFHSLVHEGRTDGAVHTQFDMSARTLLKDDTCRAILYLRDDMPKLGTPERESIPGFLIKESLHPNYFFQGVGYIVLYEKRRPNDIRNRDRLEAIAGAISFEKPAVIDSSIRLEINLGNSSRPAAKILPSCAQCNAKLRDAKYCSTCRKVAYCNRECQKGHWKQHKPSCVKEN